MEKYLLGILLLTPFLGFLINGFFWKSSSVKRAGAIGTLAAGISFLAAMGLFFKLHGDEQIRFIVHYFNWVSVGSLNVPFSFLVDPISCAMILLITGVGTLIHLFSIGYMDHDKRPAKYFSYLNLFLFSMLILVLADNLLLMFVGWEGVGLCSYLLIGFWFTDKQKALAGMKAFVVNRIGDAGFLLGMFLLFLQFGTLDFGTLVGQMPVVAETSFLAPLTLATLCLFIGAVGKSAQIPLFVWLPDAMAGPTPVSALIHAATMVTAGIYMIVRLSYVFTLAPITMGVVAVIGAVTALMAALMACCQWDIKKVLAYSTVSQLGYMFLGLGVGAFVPAFFHLLTHAFFKALLFLGSGSVIHALDHEQDLLKMGGLRKFMPLTSLTFTVGWLAIIGIPPFAGFFSKDEILWKTFNSPFLGKTLWVVGFITAMLTSFYMTRLMCLGFWGKFRGKSEPRESSKFMTGPLVALSVLAAFGGLLGLPHIISEIIPTHPPHLLESYFHGLVAKGYEVHFSPSWEWGLMGVSVLASALVAFGTREVYLRRLTWPGLLAVKLGVLYDLPKNLFYIDYLYSRYLVKPLVKLSEVLWLYIDVSLIDRMTFWIGAWMRLNFQSYQTLQSGRMQSYLFLMVIGLTALLTVSFMR